MLYWCDHSLVVTYLLIAMTNHRKLLKTNGSLVISDKKTIKMTNWLKKKIANYDILITKWLIIWLMKQKGAPSASRELSWG